MNTRKRVLVCPLNWGLGHASRDIPIIRCLLKNNFDVFIAASGNSLHLLRKNFPTLPFIEFSSFNVKYSGTSSQVLKIMMQIPVIVFSIVREHFIINKIIKKHGIDIVISDNRFGLFTKKAYTVYITHQLVIKMPPALSFFEKTISAFHQFIAKQYNECWIPDFPGFFNLSGELAHGSKFSQNNEYIGILSQFNGKTITNSQKTIKILAILSGPEPQRTIFEKKILEQFTEIKEKCVIIQGIKSTNFEYSKIKNVEIIPFVNAEELANYIQNAEYIVCRAGYTSIMDLVVLRKTALLVPTPGQTEQEYLANYLSGKRMFVTQNQNELNIHEYINKTQNVNIEIPDNNVNLLEKTISELKSKMI